MIDSIAGMLPGIIVIAACVAYQIHEERACNRAFKHERNKWKDGGDD